MPKISSEISFVLNYSLEYGLYYRCIEVLMLDLRSLLRVIERCLIKIRNIFSICFYYQIYVLMNNVYDLLYY
jgi:hypothetical protein